MVKTPDTAPLDTALFEVSDVVTPPQPVEGRAPNPGQMSHDYDEPTATQRFVQETGGGTRETLAANPPIPHKKPVNTRPIESRYYDIGSDTKASEDAAVAWEATHGTSGPVAREEGFEAAAAARLKLGQKTLLRATQEGTKGSPDSFDRTLASLSEARGVPLPTEEDEE